MQHVRAYNMIFTGRSYWTAKLTTGREVSELGMSFDLLRGRRPINWHLDVVGSGDNARVKELTINTPRGAATLFITAPHTAFAFSNGLNEISTGQRRTLAQIIGRVDNAETGDCTCLIWDALCQSLILDFEANVRDFRTWNTNIPSPGPLNIAALGVIL